MALSSVCGCPSGSCAEQHSFRDLLERWKLLPAIEKLTGGTICHKWKAKLINPCNANVTQSSTSNEDDLSILKHLSDACMNEDDGQQSFSLSCSCTKSTRAAFLLNKDSAADVQRKCRSATDGGDGIDFVKDKRWNTFHKPRICFKSGWAAPGTSLFDEDFFRMVNSFDEVLKGDGMDANGLRIRDKRVQSVSHSSSAELKPDDYEILNLQVIE